MKKSIILAAAAAMILGLASCTDEPIIPGNGNEVIDNPMVKSTADLIGTEWTYTLELNPIEFIEDTLNLTFEFGLNFDEEYAHLTFPENVTFLSASDDYTLEEIESMNFNYTYDLATTSGALITSELEIPFRYNAAEDAILIDMGLEEPTGETSNFTIAFHRK